MKNAIYAVAALAALVTLPANLSAQKATKEKGSMKTIVETAIDADGFKTLVTAVGAAGLAETLSGPGPFTVFAPADAAFAKFPAGTIDALLKDKAQLGSILTFHIKARISSPPTNR